MAVAAKRIEVTCGYYQPLIETYIRKPTAPLDFLTLNDFERSSTMSFIFQTLISRRIWKSIWQSTYDNHKYNNPATSAALTANSCRTRDRTSHASGCNDRADKTPELICATKLVGFCETNWWHCLCKEWQPVTQFPFPVSCVKSCSNLRQN